MDTRKIIARNINKLLQENNLTQKELARKVKCAESTISYLRKGERTPSMEMVDRVATALGVSRAELITDQDEEGHPKPSNLVPMPEMVRLPVVGKIACGTPILAQENIEAFYQAPKEWRANMYLTCQGDSMEPLIKNGDMVAIREQQDAETDEIVAIMELDSGDGFATLKKLKKRPDRVELWPLNPDYEPIVYLKEEINNLRIIGLAVGVIRRLHE